MVTPETDSGFVGSESSRLTPAAQSPVQQRAAVRWAALPLQSFSIHLFLCSLNTYVFYLLLISHVLGRLPCVCVCVFTLTPPSFPVSSRATRPSVSQEKCQINPKSSSRAHTQPSLDPSRAHAIASGGAPGSLGRRGEARMRHIPSLSTSSSPALRWPSTPLQPWPSSGVSELEQPSECGKRYSQHVTRPCRTL